MSTITRERAQEIFLGNGPEPTASEERELARIALASLEAEAVGYYRKGSDGFYFASPTEQRPGTIPLYAAPPAPIVPDIQHSERLDWTLGQWASHLGGRHQNNDPTCYYEFGSFMAVAEMLRQFGNVQQKVGWNACRAAMLHGGK